MFDFINYGTPQLQVFLLLIIRASGLFLSAPILSHRVVPAQFKVGLVLLLAVVTMPTVAALPIIPAQSLADLAAMVLRELMVGILKHKSYSS